MTYKQLVQRNVEIIRLRGERYSLQAIGNKYGITRERVRQLLLKHPEYIKSRNTKH